MDFDFTLEQKLFRKSVADFARKEIDPFIEKWDEEEFFPGSLWRKMGELGYLGIGYPEEAGGAGGDLTTACIFYEETAYVSAGIAASIISHHTLGAYPLLLYGNGQQKQKYLFPALAGEKITAFGLTEPNAGSDATAIRTGARRDKDGYLLSGTKMFISNGSIADYVVVAAVTDREKKARGISLLIVEKGTPGFAVGKKLKKMGVRVSDTAELIFEDCHVPRESLLGSEGDGFAALMQTLNRGRVLLGATVLGLARAAFDRALAYAQQRVQFGKPIGKFQAIQFKLADMATEIELATLLTYKTAWLYDQRRKNEKESSMTKLYGSEMAKRVVDQALQIHGGYGYMREYPIERLYRDVRIFEIVEGTSEIQRLIIARELGL